MWLRVNPPRLRLTKKAMPARGHSSVASGAIRMAGCALGGRELARHRRRARLLARNAVDRRGRQSAKSNGFQVFISLDDFAQLVLGGAVPAIGVGMVALHERFETRLDVFDRRPCIEPERIECLAFDIVYGSGLTAPRAARPPELAEHAKRIVGSGDLGVEAGGAGAGRGPAAVHAHLPGRAMADD